VYADLVLVNAMGAPTGGGRVMSLLAAGVPLTLLADLLAPPLSVEVLVREGPGGLQAT
jgi:hypothetical protein